MTNSADPDQKPTDLDLYCLQRLGLSGFSRTRSNYDMHYVTFVVYLCVCFGERIHFQGRLLCHFVFVFFENGYTLEGNNLLALRTFFFRLE